MLAGMGQISDFLDDDDKRREAASAGAGALQAATPQPATPQPATPPAAPPASAEQPESEISRFLADAPPPERGLKGWAQDIGATAVKAAIAVPEIAVGLADMVTGGHAGRAAEGLGLRFKEAKEIANDWHSEATKEAQRQFQQAEGLTGKAAAALQNPSVIASAVGEALPQMFAGGLIGRGLMLAGRAVPALAGRIGPALAGALGEGIVGAGSAAEQIRQESPNGLLTGRQAGLAGLSGLADAGFGLLGGKMAQRLGIGDVETMLAGAGRAAAKPAAQPVAKGLPRQMAQGALSEGVLEELPQSVSEQALQNIALDRPWQEDVDSAAVLGTLTGGVMGAGASGLHGLRSRPAGAEPLKPSQRMGLDANAGQLSAAAVVAVDSGASPAALAAAAQQGAQHGAQQGVQQGALQESAEAQQAALAAGQAQGPREAAALERVAALDEQLAAARQSLAALDAQAAAPDGAQDTPQQAARAQLAQQVQQLQAERESLTQGWPRMQAGKALSFGTESGAQLAGHWALAEADQLVTSHDEGLRQNPAYPQQLQPRERSRAASEAQIARMAQRLQPERLAHSADAATGAPIVGADGLVESGNARSIAIKRVYAGQGPQAAAYKDFLQAHAAEFGLTPEQVAGMQKPVLVRVRDTPVNRAEFARQANAPTVAMMSPAEQARADAARMDSMDGLEPDESGDFSGAASRGFVRRFMARLPVSEQAAMVDADGRLSSAGYARVRNAVLAKAWGTGEQGGDALARMTESLDDNTRSISRALMMAAPETARMREAIAAGARHDADIAGDVAAAAQEISRLREAGQSVQQALAQTDAFGDKHTPEARALMQFMADNARRPRRIAQLIQAYWQALDAAGDPHQQGMFGGQAAPTKQALLQAAMRQVQDAPAQGAAQERETQEREAQDRAQAAWNALPPEGRHQLALAAGVQGVVARNAARHADWSGLPAAMQQRLAQAVKAAPEAAQAALASRRAKALTDDERAAVLQGPPVASLTGDEAPRAGMQSVRQWATRLFAAQGGLARNPEIGPVVMDARSVRDSMAHGKANPFKYAAFAAVKDVLERGVLVASSTHGNLDSFYISAPVQIAGTDDVVTVLVHRDPKDQRMYLHSVATKEYLLNRRVSGADAKAASGHSGSSSSGDAASVAPAGAPGKLPGHHVAQRLHELLTRRMGAASAAPGRDNAGHETAHQSAHESGVPRGLAARETADSRQLEGIINRNLERSGQEAAFKALAVGADQLPDALRGALAAFERATGARAVVFRNLTPHVADFNGVTVRDGTLFINETSQSPITGVAAHEWLHNLRRTHPALYHELAAEVARQGDAQGFARQWGYAPGEAQEELTAAAVGDAMTDPQFLARLAEQDGSLFARVAKSFLAFLDTLTARWRSQGSNAYLRDVQAFRDKLAAVLQAYEQQAGQAGGVGQAGLPQAMFQRVWHGTPHKGIEKTGFRLDKIGTGEGLQVYGHGIYFASRREVAEFYRGMRQGQVRLDGRLMTDGHHRGAASTGDAEVDALLLDAQGDVDKAIAWARDFGQDAQAAKLERLRGRVQRGEPGQLYAAEIPEDDDLLDWDKPLDAQPAKVRRALLELAGGLPADGRAAFRQAMSRRATGQDVYAFLAQRAAGADASAEGVQKGQRAASELLLAHGIPGLRYLDGDSRNAGEGSHNYVIWDEGLLTPEAAQIAPQYSRKQATKAAYDKRIDALFAGGKAQRVGQRVLDRSDVLGLLGYVDKPVLLQESKVLQGQLNHPRMTAHVWKQVPEWLENPAAVFESDTEAGRLVAIAPETLGGAPVSIIVEPQPTAGGEKLYASLLVNAYDRPGQTPFMRWIRDGLLRYVDKKKFPAVFALSVGRRLPDTALQNKPGTAKILTEKHLAAWRKLHAGQAQPGDEAARFSRRAPEPLEPRPNEAARLKESALEQLDRVFSHPGTVSWWHKTVGTMRNLAERQPLFKPVYEAAQQFIDDVSHFANDAADFAPRLLPRLESWRDLGKRAVSAADSQAVATPLFEGTLSYTRGKDGSLVKTDNVDAAGVVFTDAELKGRFGLTPAQIGLYRQARAAIDRSIDTTARADILRLAGRDFAHLRQAVMDAPDLRAAAVQVVEAMQEVMQGDAKRRDAMRGAIEAAQERVQTAQALMQRGYAPLTRFGRYTLDVVDAQGQRQYFGLYESRREANVAAIHLRSQYPGAQVTQGTLSDDAYKLFAGITPESLELFGDLLAAPGQGKDKGQDKAFQAWLQLARNNRSAIKRLIHRKGVAGYSQDAGRVLASFIYANARQTAGALNAGRMDRAIAAIPKEQGQLRDVAMALRDYTQNPREEGQAIRGMLFAQYLGGSLASAAVNMTQLFAVTLPWLSQFGGMRQAAAQMTRALADMARPGHRYEADLARDMKKAEEDGVVSPQEIHQLMAQARGAGALRSGDGTRRGDALAAAANAWERLKVAWGQPFALAEQFNRRSTYIAAWRLARQQGMADADAFARRAVLETQFVYTKANKPRWGRGAVGGALFTFKTYSVSYLELMHRMWTQGGTPGKQGVAWMLVMLLLMGGAGGLPFMEDAEDLVDGLAQLAGYNTSVKQWRQQALQDIVGDGLAEFIESGVSGLPGAPIDISGRLGMGNLLPGTGLLLTKQNRERDLLDVAGPAGDLLARGFAAGRKLLTGDAGGAAMELAPTAVRNLAKGADMLATGSYRDAKGYKVLDTTALEALTKAAGFQPRSVAQVQEGNSFLMRSKSFYQHTSAEIKAQWARALFEKDEAALQRVRQRVADWNRHNPEQPITVRMPDIWRRVREMGKERSQRIADSAPRALRQQMRQALAQEG